MFTFKYLYLINISRRKPNLSSSILCDDLFILYIRILSGIVLMMKKIFQSDAQLNSKVFID